MRELDALVGSYVHLDKLPRAKDALRSLQKIASLVKPIMRKRGWRVGTLTEFLPDQQTLLGLNVNRGQKICLRLRYAGDRSQFMPLEHVVDTMLHELSHNVFGPHDASFHQLWNELRDEYDDLKYKGYTGEGFLSEGHRLGGLRVPLQEVRRQARQAAERRGAKKPSGHKVGGRAASKSQDIRAVIADAATRRSSITQGCASGNKDSETIANEATRNGFRTRAEEDQANDRAIAEALWELAQEEAAGSAGSEGGTDSTRQWESEGLSWNPETGLEPVSDRNKARSRSPVADSDADRPSTSTGTSTTAAATAAGSSLLPASTYQPPSKKQKQDTLLPATTYRPTTPRSPINAGPSKALAGPSASTTDPNIPKMIPPPIPPSPPPSAKLRPNPQTELMRPDSSTLGTTFTVPTTPAKRQQRLAAAAPAKTEKALPPLPSPPPPSSRPPNAHHPAFRRDSEQHVPGQVNYQPSISSIDTSSRSEDNSPSPHPSAFHSPVFTSRPAPSHSHNSSTSTATALSPSTPPTNRPAALNITGPPTPPTSVKDPMWTCPTCTLSNPSTFLCCDACTTERPCHGSIDDWSTLSQLWPDAMPTAAPTSPAELPGSAPWSDAHSDRRHSARRASAAETETGWSLPRSDSGRSSVSAVSSGASSRAQSHGRSDSRVRTAATLRTARSLAAATKTEIPASQRKLGWICRCGAFMEEKWWTCSSCSRMKEVS